jgi:hypothetical protein
MKKLFKKLSYSIVGAIGAFLMLPSKVLAQGQVMQFGNLDSLLWSIVKTIQYYTLPVMAIVLAFFGIKMMTSGDDTSAKDSAKSWFTKILIGGLIVFGATTLANVIKGAVGG